MRLQHVKFRCHRPIIKEMKSLEDMQKMGDVCDLRTEKSTKKHKKKTKSSFRTPKSVFNSKLTQLHIIVLIKAASRK